jgi:hypothetical protein
VIAEADDKRVLANGRHHFLARHGQGPVSSLSQVLQRYPYRDVIVWPGRVVESHLVASVIVVFVVVVVVVVVVVRDGVVNETEEVEAGKINLNRPFIILEKLDGSMVCPFYTEGKLRFATKNGVTDTSRIVEAFIARSPIAYLDYSALWVDKG